MGEVIKLRKKKSIVNDTAKKLDAEDKTGGGGIYPHIGAKEQKARDIVDAKLKAMGLEQYQFNKRMDRRDKVLKGFVDKYTDLKKTYLQKYIRTQPKDNVLKKIGKRGGLLGLGVALGAAGMKAKEAYDKSKEKK